MSSGLSSAAERESCTSPPLEKRCNLVARKHNSTMESTFRAHSEDGVAPAWTEDHCAAKKRTSTVRNHRGFDKPRMRTSKTAKSHTRLFVQHEYRDHAHEADKDLLSCEQAKSNHSKHGINCALFPFKLHCMLNDAERNGRTHIISWASQGRCFTIHQPKEICLSDYFTVRDLQHATGQQYGIATKESNL